MLRPWTVFLATLVLPTVCSYGDSQTSPRKETTMAISLTSTAFEEGQPIPAAYTCDDRDVSPPLQWRNLPPGVKSLALVCDDPDAPMGTWVHWVIYGISPDTTGLPEGIPARETLPSGARQGINDFGRIGYGGPCPPPGRPHRYFFRLYALDTELDLKAEPKKQDLLRAMQGHILAEGQLMGTYKRKR